MLAVTDLLRRCLVHLSSDTVADTDVLRRDRQDVATAVQSLSAQHLVMCQEMGSRGRAFCCC